MRPSRRWAAARSSSRSRASDGDRSATASSARRVRAVDVEVVRDVAVERGPDRGRPPPRRSSGSGSGDLRPRAARRPRAPPARPPRRPPASAGVVAATPVGSGSGAASDSGSAAASATTGAATTAAAAASGAASVTAGRRGPGARARAPTRPGSPGELARSRSMSSLQHAPSLAALGELEAAARGVDRIGQLARSSPAAPRARRTRSPPRGAGRAPSAPARGRAARPRRAARG